MSDLLELVAAHPALTFGIDVSSYQGAIDWPKVAAAGVRFAIVKASDWKQADKRFTRNWHGSAAAGLRRSAYSLAYFVLSGKATKP